MPGTGFTTGKISTIGSCGKNEISGNRKKRERKNQNRTSEAGIRSGQPNVPGRLVVCVPGIASSRPVRNFCVASENAAIFIRLMFIGHFAVALAAKRVAPQTSLGTLFAAAQLPDVIWPLLVLSGVEKVEIHPGDTAFTPLNFISYPWSHSLLMVTLTGTVAGLLYAAKAKYPTGGFVVTLLAVSHWLLDWISHRPDLPLYPGASPLLGLGLWNSIPSTMLIEGSMFLVGIGLYASFTQSKDRIGRYAFWSLMIFLAAIYSADRFSPPPSSAEAIGWVGVVGTAILLAWAEWDDRHRKISLPA